MRFALSIRARLALWYATVFAVSLGAIAFAGYALVAQRSMSNVDASLREAASAVATALDLERERKGAFATIAARVVREFRFRDLQVAVYDPASRVLVPGEIPHDDEPDAAPVDSFARGIAAQAFRLDVPGFGPFVASAPLTGPTFAILDADDGGVRALALPRRVGRDRHMIVIGAVHRLRNHRALLAELQLYFGLGIPLLLLVATGGGYWLARKSLRPVSVMTDRAAQISATTLHERLPVMNDGDELGRLAKVFNDLLARLDAAFEQQRQFIADASHELRTPVAIARGEAELALSRDDRSPDELRVALRAIEEEMHALQRIVEDLFLLARAHAGERLLHPAELYLGELAAECARSARSLALKKGVRLTFEGNEDLPMRGDEALLRRLVMNLVDNAIKYTPSGGEVRVVAEATPSAYVITVRDNGPGIPPEARANVFDRFYRAQRSRQAGDPASGAGLGLAIARSIAEAHGGMLTLASSDDSGSAFRLTLPAPPASSRERPALALSS